MESIGQRLRQERLRKGLKLQDIAERTRIRTAFLEAIEADRFDSLPGRFFARSFVRQYARLLEMEEAETEAAIAQQLADPGPQTSPEQVLAHLAAGSPEVAPVLTRGRAASHPAKYVAAAALAIAAAAGGYLGWRQAQVRAETQRSISTAGPGPAAPAQAPMTPPAPQAGEPPAQTPGPSALVPEAPPPSAAPAPEQTPASQPEAPLTAEVAALRPSWIQVAADGKVVFSDTLQPGQSRLFRAQQTIRILTGNAGGLQIRSNGHALGPVGPEGQIRTVELTPQGHQILAPAPKRPPPDSAP
jgi:cytoskeleton protein RodZ